MSRFRNTQGDSLELLLDTICNAFGGIVLIAILITLLTKDARQRVETQQENMDRELVERQIASLQSDIKEAKEYLERQAPSVSVDPALVANLDKAQAALQTAKDKNAEAWRAWKDSASKAAGHDPEADKVLGDKVAMASKLARLKTAQDALHEKADRLKQRLEALRQERARVVSSKAESLRLPKEQPERGGQMNFVLNYDEVYPLVYVRNGNTVPNRGPLDWQEMGDDSFKITPQKGKGISPSAIRTSLQETFDYMKSERGYAAIYIDDESVNAYRAMRKELVNAGIPFGWSFDQSHTHNFGKHGSSPPPL